MSTNNTGRKFFTMLQEYDAITGLDITGVTKPNVSSDPNFIDPVFDETVCPVYVPFTVIADRGLQGATFVLSGGKDNQSLTILTALVATYLTQFGRDKYTLTVTIPNNVLSVIINGLTYTIPQAPLPGPNWTFQVLIPVGALTIQTVSQPGIFVAGTSTCEQSGTPPLNDGKRTVVLLNEVYSLSGAPTGVSKNNVPATSGYIAPYSDPVNCPPAQNISLTTDAGAVSTTVQLIGTTGQGTFNLAISTGQSGSIRVPAGIYSIAVSVDKSVVDTVSINGDLRQTAAPYTGTVVIPFTKGPGDQAIVVHTQVLVYSGHEPGTCQVDGLGNNTGMESYAQRDVKYLRSGVLLRTEANATDANFIGPVTNTTLCPKNYSANMNITTSANVGGSIATHSSNSEVVVIPDNTAGVRSIAINRPQSNNDSVSVQVPQASTLSVTANGITQPVTPAASGMQSLNFGSQPQGDFNLSIAAQPTRYAGYLPVCEQGVGAILSPFVSPHCIRLWTNGTLRRLYVSNYNAQYVSVIDAVALVKLGDISIPSMAPGRGVAITPLNKVAVSTETGSLYIIDPLLGAFGQVANQAPINPRYTTNMEYIAAWGALVIPDTNGYALLLCDPTTGALIVSISLAVQPVSVMQISSTVVLVGCNNGTVMPVDIASKNPGTVINLEVGGPVAGNILSSMSFNATLGVVYIIGRANKTLYAITVGTYAIVRTRSTAIIDQPFFIAARNKLYVTANEGNSSVYNGRLYEYETVGFTITNNINLGAQSRPLFLAYDSVTDDIFVTDYGVLGANGTRVLGITPGNHTGKKVYSQLQLVFSGSGVAVSPVTVKNNTQGDPDYIAPFTDSSCT